MKRIWVLLILRQQSLSFIDHCANFKALEKFVGVLIVQERREFTRNWGYASIFKMKMSLFYVPNSFQISRGISLYDLTLADGYPTFFSSFWRYSYVFDETTSFCYPEASQAGI